MKCSRCGSRYPDPSCYVCGSDDDPTKPETADSEGGSLLKTMHPDTARTISATFCVALAATFVVVAATGGIFAALLVIAGFFVFFLFVGLTQPS